MGVFRVGAVTRVGAGARPVTVLGAATSAGTHHAGQERAPYELRAGGFIARLVAGGLVVTDFGDVVHETFRVDAGHGPARNVTATVRAARVVADVVEDAAGDGSVLLVLGGDCTITLGVLAGLQRVAPDAGLVYFDGDADLGTPGHGSGILDAMGIAHLLGLAETELTGLFATRPPLSVRRLAMLGYDETDPESYQRSVFDARPDLTHFPDYAVRADPVDCARRALSAVREASRLIVHFDVDAVDSGDLPLANFPHYGTGVPLAVARQALSVLFAAPALSAVVLTEVNPSYDPSGDSLDRYIEAVTGALISGLDQADR
jgi:arginase